MAETMSKSRRKREAFNYRAAYFKKNPGLCGCIWFCSQCNKPLIGRSNVQVDHIIPLAGHGINRTINTVAICAECNRKKSDKGGIYIVKGTFAKIRESIILVLQKIVLWTVVLVIRVIYGIISLVYSLLSAPFSFSSTPTKIVAVLVYVVVAWYLIRRR